MTKKNNILKAIEGSLLGTAVGDFLGLPYEGLSKQRATKLFGAPTKHRLISIME